MPCCSLALSVDFPNHFANPNYRNMSRIHMAVLIRFVPILAQAALHYPNWISISQWAYSS